jgi:hypothetical protein
MLPDEQKGDHRAEMMAGSDRLINYLTGGWSFGEGQVRAVPRLESRHDPALPVDSHVKGMSSNVKTAMPVRTHPKCATLGWFMAATPVTDQVPDGVVTRLTVARRGPVPVL